jgi:hypothetical protein
MGYLMSGEMRWAFDIDSVVGDLSAVLERVAREIYQVPVSRFQFTDFRLEECLPFDPGFIAEWISRALDPYWTEQMAPYEGAVETLTEIARERPLLFVTARAEMEPVRGWLMRQLPEVSADRIEVCAVGPSGSKLPVLLERRITHFVEDRVETCDLLWRQGIMPVVFEQPWNVGRHEYRFVRDWYEIRDLILDNGHGGLSWPG